MSLCVKIFVFLLLYEKFAFVLCANTETFTFVIAGGYRPTEHILAKYIVSIRYIETKQNFGYKHYCGGSILSPRVILTAAHCVWDEKNNEKKSSDSIVIVAGTPNRFRRTPHTQIAYAKSITLHTNYDQKTISNDIAAIHLTSKLKLDGIYAQPIAITDLPPNQNQNCTIVGWGRMYEKGPTAADCMYADLNILHLAICENVYGITLDDSMLCGGALDDIEINSCKGDSGGPMICDDKLYGIVSFGANDDGYPSVYANVWYYRDWIIANGQIAWRVEILAVSVSILFAWIM